MKPVLVLYATREGQTRSIAEYLAAIIRTRGFEASVFDAAHLPGEFKLEDFQCAGLPGAGWSPEHRSRRAIVDEVYRLGAKGLHLWRRDHIALRANRMIVGIDGWRRLENGGSGVSNQGNGEREIGRTWN